MVATSKVNSAKKDIKKAKGRKAGAPSHTVQSRAQIIFPPSRFMRMMRRDGLNQRIGKGSSICMAAVVEYLTSEIMEIAGTIAQEDHRKRINNRDLYFAIRKDEELSKLYSDIVVHEGGVIPHIEQALLPKKKGGKHAEKGVEPSQEV